jgi:hypothetical protein
MVIGREDVEGIARWGYIFFVVLAIGAGLIVGYMVFSAEGHWSDAGVAVVNGWVILVMAVLGIIIGLTMISAKEVVDPFLIATIALIVAAAANVWSPLGAIHELLYYWASAILSYIVAFASPAAVIMSIKAVLHARVRVVE